MVLKQIGEAATLILLSRIVYVDVDIPNARAQFEHGLAGDVWKMREDLRIFFLVQELRSGIEHHAFHGGLEVLPVLQHHVADDPVFCKKMRRKISSGQIIQNWRYVSDFKIARFSFV